jgi:nitrate reductase alpha subunit
VRASWDEVVELIAAAHVHAIRRFGPDRCVGFTPIPAMSMASYASGTRFLSLIGGVILSFYDRYADLPRSSPQTFAGYLIVWAEMSPGRRKRPTARYLERAGRRRNRLVAGTSRKRLMGLEPYLLLASRT